MAEIDQQHVDSNRNNRSRPSPSSSASAPNQADGADKVPADLGSSSGSSAVTSSTTTNTSVSWEENFVKRHTSSINFTKNGARTGESPKAKSAQAQPQPPLRVRGRSLLAEIAAETGPANARQRASSDQQSGRYDSVTGQPIVRRLSRRERIATRHPMLQTSLDEHESDQDLQDQDFLQMCSPTESSTSASTVSPPFELGDSRAGLGADYLQSPDSASSPILIPGSESFPRGFSRSKTFGSDRTGSLRRVNRRSSTRTGSSSFSPASAFLSQYRDEPAGQAEQDDEGQEIGDNGEYIIGRQIGFGGFSVVKEVFTIENDEKVRRAVKIVRKHITGQTEQDNENVQTEFEHEVFIWRYLKHRYILPLLAVYDNPFATFCIIQFNAGGTLFDLIRRQRKSASFVALNKSQSNSDATSRGVSPMVRKIIPLTHVKRYLYQIACALRYLHQDMRIVHRDLKLENCLLDTTASLTRSISSLSNSVSSLSSLLTDPADPGDILLCDFGMADFIAREDRDSFRPSSSHGSTTTDVDPELNLGTTLTTLDGTRPAFVAHNIGPGPVSAHLTTSATINTSTNVAGSLQYASPELIRASQPLYDPSIDMWAFGVVSFALLTGELPFSHGLAPKVQSLILQGDWSLEMLKESVGRSLRVERDPDESPADTSNTAADAEQIRCAVEMVSGCLAMDVYTRWDIARVLSCGFLHADEGAYERQQV